MRDELVYHDRFMSTKAAIMDVVARAEKGDPQLLPVFGPTRVGKTTLLNHSIREIIEQRGDEKSVISVVSPKHLTGRALPDACLAAIGMSATMFRNHVAATDAFIKAVYKRDSCLIVFDETQHMLERGSSTTVRAAADFLKLISDQTDASIVISGLPSSAGLFQANEQLADRARRPVHFYPYDWHGSDYKCFRASLAAALEYLDDQGWKTFDVKDSKFARRMYVATAGRFGLIRKIFMEVQATGRPGEAFYPMFAKAYEEAVMDRLIDFNPFDPALALKDEHMAKVYVGIMREAGVTV